MSCYRYGNIGNRFYQILSWRKVGSTLKNGLRFIAVLPMFTMFIGNVKPGKKKAEGIAKRLVAFVFCLALPSYRVTESYPYFVPLGKRTAVMAFFKRGYCIKVTTVTSVTFADFLYEAGRYLQPKKRGLLFGAFGN